MTEGRKAIATIALYASQINQMTAKFKSVQTSVTDYKETLFSLQKQALTINKSACELEEVITSIKTSTQTQDDKAEALSSFITESEEFINEAERIDGDVRDVINERKNDFYEEYEYLRPECEKKEEKKGPFGWLTDAKKTIGKYLKKAGEWCKEHWKAVVTVVLVIVAVVLICTGVGGILGAMAMGALLGALIGGVSGGIMAAATGGSFWEGFEDGAFMGAISGIITGGIAGGNTAATLTLGKTMFIGGASSGGSQFLSDLGDILIKGEDISIGTMLTNTVVAGVLGTLFAAAGYGLNKAFSWTKSLFKGKSDVTTGKIWDYSKQFDGELANFNTGYEVKNIVDEDLYLVQFHSDAEVGNGRSLKYWTTFDEANGISTVDDYMDQMALLSNWGTRDNVSIAKIPAGTKIKYAIGTAKEQVGAIESRPGGGKQILFQQFNDGWVLDTKPLP